MTRQRGLRSAVLALAAMLATSGAVLASHWYPANNGVTLPNAPDVYLPGDSFYVYARMSWSAAAAQVVRDYARNNGYRFTSDARDCPPGAGAPCNLNAVNGTVTNFPNPVWDADDDNGDGKAEEGEVTANSTSFPTAGTIYYTKLRFTRHYELCNDYLCYPGYWDPDGGKIRQIAQMSYKPCAWCEWDSVGFTDKIFGTYSYPYKARPAGAASAPATTSDHADATAIPAVETEAALDPDISNGLDTYRTKAHRAADKLLAAGPARGVATFAAPLSERDLAALQRSGLQFHRLEAIALKGSERLTVFVDYGPDAWRQIGELAIGEDATLQGVVAADVSVADRGTWRDLRRDSRIYVVDFAPERVMRADPTITDVVMNDVYWHLAGWE